MFLRHDFCTFNQNALLFEGKNMPIKTDAKKWIVLEQIVEDPATGLTFQFEVTPDGEPRLRLFGEKLPFGNREIHFDRIGMEAGSSTVTSGSTGPSWSNEVTEQGG
jgi:hypothetical protein